MINRRWFFAVLIAALAAMMVVSRCRGCHYDVPLDTSSTSTATTSSSSSSTVDNDDDDRIFRQLRLDVIKEKMLRRLGLSGPPRIVASSPHHGQNSLRRDLRMLPIGRRFSPGQRRRPRNPQLYLVASNGHNNNKVTRVIVFAELTPCVTPAVNAKTSEDLSELTKLTFKLPRLPSVIRNAVLWYKTSADSSINTDFNSTNEGTTTLDGGAWLCPCGFSANVTQVDGSDRCTRHTSISSESKVSADGQQRRRGWNYIRFPGFGGLESVQLASRQYGNGERPYVTFLVGSASILSEQKRPFLVLEVINRISRSRRNRRSGDDRPTDCTTFPGVNRGLLQQQSRCCRTGFWVNIRQLGWSDWIISPSGFYYHYCSGRCDSTFDSMSSSSSSNGSNGDANNGAGQALLDYSQVMNAYVKRFQLNLKPCCVPRTMSHLPVVITTDGLTLNRTYIPNFIVDECACLGVA